MSNSAQQTINERLKILIDALKLSARAFSAQLQVPESNTRNYLDKNTKLNSDYLERISLHFKSVNLTWLITGEGEPFIQKSDMPSEPEFNYTGNNYGNSVGSNRGGTVTQHKGAMPTVVEGPSEVVLLRAMIKQLEGQLADKERTIQILLSQQSK